VSSHGKYNLTFYETAELFSKVSIPFCIPMSGEGVPVALRPHQLLRYTCSLLVSLHSSHSLCLSLSNRCVASPCGFNLQSMTDTFSCATLYL
jgi:hypothetical protein